MQLLRISTELCNDYSISYVTTNSGASALLPDGATLDTVTDFSRWDAWKLPGVFASMWRIVSRRRPDAIVTTGAAPGLIAVAIGRLRGITTIWVDSIANASELSGSGKIASRLADKTFTQWPHLAAGNVEFHGTTLGSPQQEGGPRP